MLRPRTLIAAAASAVLAATALVVPLAGPASAAPPPGPLVWSDEFNGAAGSAVDQSKWRFDIGGSGWGNNEQQYYTNSTRNAAMDGAGNLVITARRENPSNFQCHYGTCQYTSARLLTAATFNRTYGRFEARMKIPRGQGIWPAFWMLGNPVNWPTSGEIDIMENIGREPNTVHGTIHGPGYSGAEGIGAGYTIGGAFADAFHTFTVDWSPNLIVWYVDGNEYQRRTPADLGGDRWVFDHNFFMIMNVAVGGYWPGYPDGSTTFPQSMTVDYVRAYALPGGGGPTNPPTGGGRITGIGGKCVDVAGANPANGTAVQLWDCNGTAAQQWTWAADGSVRALGKCLDVPSGSTPNGAKLHLWDCNGSGAQRWTFTGANDIVNPQSNKCMDATGNSSANGTRLQIWDCGGGANQKWSRS